ncbi:type IV secretion system protein [Paraburkholderia rhizosphaerae]|uniref:TrbL/VirB6 plasmid conjugal transfer protein n=1 Tax=Paraburkholderia rhizosphaerae TaxID=480658 RepID=A0A4R8LP62_9BURK|nr:type IV secretion system protein [Paraburkholderia rhizosphaerae]TDY48077.1 TrbL/VirB6 plasmid conjugal transfer protein [Paraburkholderia rhizosphaerae]
MGRYLRCGQRAILIALIACVTGLVGVPVARADDAGQLPAGTPAPTNSATGPTVQPTEVSQGSTLAVQKLTEVVARVVDAAVEASQSIRPEADRFAFGLAVITIVLAAVKFSAAHHPVTAWVALFEELAVLGIFAGFYAGYAGWAPNFYRWFFSLSQTISGGANMTNAGSIIFTVAGGLFDGFISAFKSSTWWQWFAIATSVVPLFFAWIVLTITSIVFVFFVSIGQVQMAVGFVVGQIALALGFSSFTRGWFRSWLDYMISAGMYVVVAAILTRLVTNSVAGAIQDSLRNGLSLTTPYAASYVLDLSLFVFLLSFEIPKMAAMFGGGASASGSAIGKVGRAAAAAV